MSKSFLIGGDEPTTVLKLHNVMKLESYRGLLRIDHYPSLSFKKNIDNKKLAAAIGMLTEFVRIDPRGGYFSQKVMGRAVTMTLTDDPEFTKHLVEQGCGPTEGFALVAYKTRVELAHLRLKFDGKKEGDEPSPFDEVYNIMKNSAKTDGSYKKDRRSDRLGITHPSNRPHPFINFRGDNEGEGEEDENKSDDDEEEEVITVARYWDPVEFKAVLLKSDGQLMFADTYNPSGDGFVIAGWLHDGSNLQLDIPETCLVPNLMDEGGAGSPGGSAGGGPVSYTHLTLPTKRIV